MDELQASHARTVGPPEGKSAKPEGPNGEIRGIVEALLYGCAIWTPLYGHNNEVRTSNHKIYCFESSEPGASRRITALSPTKTPTNGLDIKV